jgi:hypothetical protein
VFFVVSGAFYTTLAERVPGTDPSSPELRAQVQPLNRPHADAPPAVQEASRIASTDAFRLAATVCAVLLVAGAVTNWVGLRETAAAGPQADPPTTGGPAGSGPD